MNDQFPVTPNGMPRGTGDDRHRLASVIALIAIVVYASVGLYAALDGAAMWTGLLFLLAAGAAALSFRGGAGVTGSARLRILVGAVLGTSLALCHWARRASAPVSG